MASPPREIIWWNRLFTRANRTSWVDRDEAFEALGSGRTIQWKIINSRLSLDKSRRDIGEASVGKQDGELEQREKKADDTISHAARLRYCRSGHWLLFFRIIKPEKLKKNVELTERQGG